MLLRNWEIGELLKEYLYENQSERISLKIHVLIVIIRLIKMEKILYLVSKGIMVIMEPVIHILEFIFYYPVEKLSLWNFGETTTHRVLEELLIR